MLDNLMGLLSCPAETGDLSPVLRAASYECSLIVVIVADGKSAADLPFFRRSITPRALTWKNRQQPSSSASTLLTGYFPYLYHA
jgi:hypothetical protein